MVDLMSTPILVTIILGVVGLAIPVIDAARRERGIDRNKLYSAIAFGALIVAMGIVIFKVFTGEVLPAVAFSEGVLVDEYADRLEMTSRRGEYWRLAFQGNLHKISDEDYEVISKDVDAAIKKVAV